MVMDTNSVLERLGYADSPFFLRGKRLLEDPGYSHFFRKAQGAKSCKLVGVYALRQPAGDNQGKGSVIPTVYVCEADNEIAAEKIHRRVWNQNIVPYLVIVTKKNVRLYSGFEYDRNQSDGERVLVIARDANEILSKLSAFSSESIDSGDIWKQQKISTEKRVDRRLLANLDKLSEVLRGDDYGLSKTDAHSLIGKYVYLKYLRDREILSDARLLHAGVNEEHVFSRRSQKEKLYVLEEYLDEFLNGSVFPLPSRNRIQTKHVQKVAGVFMGDDPDSRQMHLDFRAYDFSYIPIETLSVVYQQFLHEKGEGRSKGAYYTPVHLVNFVLDELEAKKPLEEGMKVFDPSCGSGAFLVQCYRRLVEKVSGKEGELRPTRLRELLEENIFGLDADEEACRVAQLSLSLTLLDYIDPPDLSKTNFKLPNLDGQNIFHCEGGFFDEDSVWAGSIPEDGYDWIVGNPPWKNVKKKEDEGQKEKLYDRKAVDWIDDNRKICPVDNYQSAEAFAWKTKGLLSEDGQCGLILPAMTLFKKQGDKFRCSFFSQVEVWCIVNFANIRRYLFEGAINPAAAFFFSGKKDWGRAGHYITTYSPFAVEQSGQLDKERKSNKMWSVFVNYSIIKEISIKEVREGTSTPWKLAMWGMPSDKQSGRRICGKHTQFKDFIKQNDLAISEGLQLRFPGNPSDEVELVNEVQGKDILVMDKLKGVGNIHSFPKSTFEKLPKDRDIYTRKGRKNVPLNICTPPHIFVNECRSISVYSNSFFVVPPRQIGISGDSSQQDLLKALALYLKSNVAYYLQFWSTAAMGVERDVFILDDLKSLPVPLSSLSEDEVTEWAMLHDEIVEAGVREREAREAKGKEAMLWDKKDGVQIKSGVGLPKLDDLLGQMNKKVYGQMGISKKQRWLIEDMLDVRMKLNDGRIAKEAVKPASKKEIESFARIFQEELDLFLDHEGRQKVHKVKVLFADNSVVMIVEHLKRSTRTDPEVMQVDGEDVRRELNDLQEKLKQPSSSQWMYFTRCLRVYRERRTYIFKPRERLYWLKSQALADADEFIAEKLATE